MARGASQHRGGTSHYISYAVQNGLGHL